MSSNRPLTACPDDANLSSDSRAPRRASVKLLSEPKSRWNSGHAGRDAASKELAEVRSESEELRKQIEAARNERQQTADSLSSSQQAVTGLTETLQNVSDARDSLGQQIAASKVHYSILLATMQFLCLRWVCHCERLRHNRVSCTEQVVSRLMSVLPETGDVSNRLGHVLACK